MHTNQVDSFVAPLSIPVIGEAPFPAVFIRAPIIEEAGDGVQVGQRRGRSRRSGAVAKDLAGACSGGPGFGARGMQVLARLPGRPANEPNIVAVRQGPLLATAFHPELTSDARFHRYFVNVVRESKGLPLMP